MLISILQIAEPVVKMLIVKMLIVKMLIGKMLIVNIC